MSLQSKITKAALCIASGALVAGASAGTALADNHSPAGGGRHGHHRHHVRRDHRHGVRGRVVSRHGVRVHRAPNYHSRTHGFLHSGEKVLIVCKARGEEGRGHGYGSRGTTGRYDGGREGRWYKLADGRYAWAPGRYIRTDDRSPKWCGRHHFRHHRHF